MESKSMTIAISIEPTLYALLAQEAATENKALSAYGRSILIKFLVNSGRLDLPKLTALLSGDSSLVISQIINAEQVREALDKAEANAI